MPGGRTDGRKECETLRERDRPTDGRTDRDSGNYKEDKKRTDNWVRERERKRKRQRQRNRDRDTHTRPPPTHRHADRRTGSGNESGITFKHNHDTNH